MNNVLIAALFVFGVPLFLMTVAYYIQKFIVKKPREFFDPNDEDTK